MAKLPQMPLGKWIDIPPVWLLGFIALAVVLGRAFPVLDPGVWWLEALGWLLLACGFALTVLALAAFARAQTTPIPHQMPSALITTGIFRFSRNPIYLADAAFMAAICLLQAAWITPVLVPAFVWVITQRFILPEETRLRARFGPAFDDWSRNTRRWL